MNAIGNKVVAIEHIGSTAVPGLGAKPIIDIMVGLRQLSDAEDCIEPLRRIGYEYVPELEAEIPERRYFHKGPSNVPKNTTTCTWSKYTASSGTYKFFLETT